MKRCEYDRIRSKLLATRQEYPPMVPMDLFQQLRKACNLSDHDTKEVIGRLLDDRVLLFTKDRKFQLAPEETLV